MSRGIALRSDYTGRQLCGVPRRGRIASKEVMRWTAPTRHLCAKLGAVERIERKEPSTSPLNRPGFAGG